MKPLVELSEAQDLSGLARGIAFRLTENFGVLKRESIADEMKSLDQAGRAQLRRFGVRFGAFNIHFPLLLKPAPAELTLVLWALKHAGENGLSLDALPQPPRPGLTSTPADPAVPEPFYRACGYHVCGPRAVRIDILERLADLVRPLLAWRPNPENPSAPPPKGSTGDGGFLVIPEMMSILGCSPDELSDVFKSLGFRLDRRPVKQKPVEQAKPEPVETQESEAGATASADAVATEPAVGEAVDGVAAPLPEVPAAAAPEAPAENGASIDAPAEANAIEPEAAPVVADSEAVSAPEAEKSAAVPEEVKYEDVWRPRRRHEERPDRRRRVSQEAGQQQQQRGGDVRPGRNRDQRFQKRGGDRQQPAPAAAAAGGGGGGAPQRQPTGDGQKFRDRNKGGRPDGRRGDDRRRNQDRQPAMQMRSSPPKRTEVDPDSPFAALGALKKALDKQAQEPGTS